MTAREVVLGRYHVPPDDPPQNAQPGSPYSGDQFYA
jgi:hypothetical protein